jgi:hypothetical protein
VLKAKSAAREAITAGWSHTENYAAATAILEG